MYTEFLTKAAAVRTVRSLSIVSTRCNRDRSSKPSLFFSSKRQCYNVQQCILRNVTIAYCHNYPQDHFRLNRVVNLTVKFRIFAVMYGCIAFIEEMRDGII